MKKIYLFLLTLCLVSIYSLPAAAGDDLAFVEKDGIHYTVKGKNQVYIINSFHYWRSSDITDQNYSWLDGRDVEIPKSVYVRDGWHAIYGHQNIIGVERYAFENMTAKVNLTLPTTIKNIDPYSFENATGLQSITLQEGIESIGQYAFYGCSQLTNVDLPTTLKSIARYTFYNCFSLRNVTIPSTITTIEGSAFSNCGSLESVNNGKILYVEEIGDFAFKNCYHLQHIYLSNNLLRIGESAFLDCLELEKITLPRSLKVIDAFAFSGTGLKEVTNYSPTPQNIQANVFDGVKLSKCFLFVPKGCKEAYQNAKVWKEFGQILEVGDRPAITGVSRIGDLYYDLHEDMTATLVKHDINKNLSESLTIPATVSFDNYGFTYTYTVNKMEDEAFKDCANLTSVEVPATIDEIPASAFSGCAGLTKVTFPSSLSKIGGAAFNNCSALKNLALPGSLKEIGASAFSGCKSLTYVSVPAGVEVLPYSCFLECSQLSTILLPEGLKEIGAHAFNLCTALTTITLPESLTKLGDYALTAGENLTSIRSLNETPPTATDATFGSVASSGKCIVYVPVGSKEAYQKATGWKDFTDIREQGVKERIQVDGLYYQLKEDFTAEVTFEREVDNYSNIGSEVTVKDKVVYQGAEYKVNAVGAYAFANSQKITKVNLPKILDEISNASFRNCSNLAEINIPATLRLLYKDAFEGTKLFNENKDKNGAVYYEGCLLYYPVSTIEGEYVLKDGTRLLATNVFENDEKITSLVLPEGVQCLCNYAISYMYALKKLSLPSSIFHIGDGFCNDCFYLSEIYNNSNVPYNMTDVYCFDNVNPSKCSLYVPNGSKEAYSQADKWKDLNIKEMDPYFAVTFVDYNGSELDVQYVQKGKDATAPEEPKRDGYDFTGWDRAFTNIQSELTVTAQYKLHTYSVLFVDGYTDSVIDTQYVPYGGSATAPEAPKFEGYVFIGWDKEFNAISENTVVTALYLEGDGIVTTVFHPAQRTLTYYFDPELKERIGITEVYNPSSDAVRFDGYSKRVEKIEIDPSMKKSTLTTMRNLFYGGVNTSGIMSLQNVTRIVGLENLNTSIVTDMNGMFALCESMTELDLSSFDTRNVTNMNGMFTICSNLQKVDLSSFDISNVTDMNGMFMGCGSLTTICCNNDWSNTSAQSANMFFGCKALVGDKGTAFDSNVVDARYARPDGGTDAPGYFTEKMDKVYTEFAEETGTLTFYYDDKIDTRTGVTELYVPGSVRFTGYNEKVLKGVIDPSMKNAPITSMRGMFEGGFNSETFKIQDLKKMTSIVGLENLNTSIVTDMNGMFSGCESLTALDLSSFDTKNVTNFAYMFMGCTGLQIVDVNSFDISNATDMRGMFSSCWELTTICCSNDWSNCQADTYIMFSGCKKLVGDKGTVFDNNTLDKTYARPDGGTSAPGYFTADTMTGIKKVQDVQKVQGVQENIYNLSGQRVNRPVQKGLYIINGKKMMVK